MKINKKNYNQIYLEECKYKIKKTKFIEAGLKLDGSVDPDDSNSSYSE